MGEIATRVRRSTLGLYIRLAQSRWTRLCDVRVVERLATTLWNMSLDDVCVALDALEQAGLTVWLSGGWAVDALLGVQTRPHADLDVFVAEDPDYSLDAAVDALAPLGYRRLTERPRGARIAMRVVVFDSTGRFIDLISVDRQRARLANLTPTASESAVVTGSLAGRAVQCLDSRSQLALHQDVSRLARRSRGDIAKLRQSLAASELAT